MTKDEILKYIMQTPENTNPNVLRDVLGETTGGGDLNYNFHLKMCNTNLYDLTPNNDIICSIDPPDQLPVIFNDLKIADIELKDVSFTGDPTSIVLSPDDFNGMIFFVREDEEDPIAYAFIEPISIPVVDGSLLEASVYYAVQPVEGFLINGSTNYAFIIIPTKYNSEEYIKLSQGTIHY